MPIKLTHGYVVLGPTTSARVIVDDANAIWEKYLSADPLLQKSEGYLSLYTFTHDIYGHHAVNPMLPDFQCPTCAEWLHFDIDRGNTKEELAQALKDTQALVICLIDDLGVDPRDIIVFFSGGKGFHIAVRMSTWNPIPAVEFPHQVKLWAEFIAKKAGIKVDMICDRMRILRLPNTQHPSSHLFKSPMTYEELMSWSIDEILDRAKSPRAFTVPASEGRTNPKMSMLWAKCVEIASLEVNNVAKLKAEPAKVFYATIDFIVNGAAEGTRNDRLYAAAANLSDFSDRNSLIVELLYDAAKRSGLSDAEILRTIKSALERKKQ